MASGEDPQAAGSGVSNPGTFTLNISDLPIHLSTATQEDLATETPEQPSPGRIQANINRVMQDIWPQIEQRITQQALTALRSGNPQIAPIVQSGVSELPLHPHHRHGTQENQFVIDLGGNPGADLNQNMTDQGNGETQAQHQQQVPNLRHIVKGMEGSLPFLFLILAKVLYNHRLGILVFVGLFGTFYHANSSLRRLVAQREMRNWADSLGGLAWIIALLGANIFFIYYVFESEQLFKCLYFRLPEIEEMDLWNLCWVVGLTDFVIKFGTILIKAVLALLPRFLLPAKKKGKYYMLIETTSQFYRSLLPIMPWVYFLQSNDQGGQWFSVILLILYLVCKVNHVIKKLKDLKSALVRFRVDVSYGTKPSREQLQAADNHCPICQDKFSDPVRLSCTHVFCEDCVSMWFDRERTCPMCRANIVDNPQWRDGSTSAGIQCY